MGRRLPRLRAIHHPPPLLARQLLAAVVVALSPFPADADPPGPADSTSSSPARITAPARSAAEVLAQAIRISTVNPPGAEAPLAELFVDLLEESGIEARVVPTPSDDAAPRAAAWGRLEGSGARRPIVLLSHLDVVPAEADEWDVPPFDGVIRDGIVHGRGSLDAKGVAVVQLFAIRALARRATPLARDVIFLATPDEENGGALGAGHLARSNPELVADAEFLLTEGSGIRPASNSEPTVWGVAISEKSPCWLKLTARGTPGHSSAPKRGAAVPRLIAALDRIRRIETPIRVSTDVARMFARIAPHATRENREGYEDLKSALARDSGFRRRFLRNPSFNALVRNTISVTVLQGGERTNTAPAEAHAHLDVRLLPGESCEAFRGSIVDVIADPEIEVSTLLAFPSNSSPVDTELFSAIERVATERDPGALVIPRMIAGFTDAHWFRELGIVSYGFVPRRLKPEDTRGVHGVNERIAVAELERAIEVLVEILEEMGE